MASAAIWGIVLLIIGAHDTMMMLESEDFIERWRGIAKKANVMIVSADIDDLPKGAGTAYKIVEEAGSARPAALRLARQARSPRTP